MISKRLLYLIIIASFGVAKLAAAQVVFNEIMYDALGADSGREWIEIMNAGGSSVIISTSTWKLFEADTNHKLSLFRGNLSLPVGGFAIIADDAEKFLNDWPKFSGTIFDSAFSLSQTGESLVLKSSSTTVEDSVRYVVEKSYKEGNSLQKINGVWKSFFPTPGLPNVEQHEIVAAPVVTPAPPAATVEKTAVIVPNPKPAVSQAPAIEKKAMISKAHELMVANVSQSVQNTDDTQAKVTSSVSSWLYAVGGVIALGIIATFLPKGKEEKETKVENKVDEYTIIE